MAQMERREFSCGAVVFKRVDGRILYLLLRSAKSGHWTPPKGHAEQGETEEDTARREVLEEAGLSQCRPAPGFRKVLRYPVRSGRRDVMKEAVYFLWEAESPQARLSHEHTEMGWYDIDEALALSAQYPLQQGLLREADAFLEGTGQ
jgi:bis(5'-nucleosidyl)-tetraphosphatase